MLTSPSQAPTPARGRLPRRRFVVLSTCGALVATALVPSASALGAAAPAGPIVTLVGASTSVTLTHFPGEDVFLDDLGVYGVTGGSTVEVRTHRPNYRTAAVSDLVLRFDGRKKVTRLPAGLVKGFDGLTDFTTMTVKNAKGAVVGSQKQTWCPGGFNGSRVAPDAKAVSPYPFFCQGSPWSLGTVTGQPAHWASSISGFSFFGDGSDVITLKDGTYTVTTSMSAGWRKAFRTPAAKASVTVKVVVKTVDLPPGAGGDAAATASALRAGGTGTPAQQAARAARSQFPAGMPASLLGRADGALPRASGAGVPATTGFAAPRAESVPSAPGASPLSAATGAMDRVSARRVPARYRPDLRSLPASNAVITGDFEDPLSTKEYLAFTATVWNAGPAPLVVDGYRRPGAPLMDAYQFFYDGKGKQVAWTNTGNLKYDPRSGHEHWHFLDFAKYELVTPAGKTILSQKEAFCLAPTDAVDLTGKGARYQPNSTGLSTACGSQQSIAIRETLDAGWGDTYAQFLPGQSFDITTLPNGTYVIKVTANPSGNLFEGSTTNNVSERSVVLGGTKGARTVKVLPVDGLNIP